MIYIEFNIGDTFKYKGHYYFIDSCNLWNNEYFLADCYVCMFDDNIRKRYRFTFRKEKLQASRILLLEKKFLII
jgi:hypothetical protein